MAYKVNLTKRKDQRGISMNWTKCAPFVENSMGQLIHRPVSIAVHNCLKKPHLSIHFACGMFACGTKKFTFLETLNESHIVCERCEEKSLKDGLQSSSEICGKHVHIGKTKAIANCCK